MPLSAVAAYYRPIADAVRAQPPSIVLAHNAPILVRLLRKPRTAWRSTRTTTCSAPTRAARPGDC
jgi:hypothetical protein